MPKCMDLVTILGRLLPVTQIDLCPFTTVRASVLVTDGGHGLDTGN